MSPDVIVLGAGAAGLMAALTAGRRGRRVICLERAAKPGAKILVSGGGRCNFTNLAADAGHYVSQNPHFAKSALARYSPSDFLALVQSHGIPVHEKSPGQYFCDRSSRDILELLLREAGDAKVEVVTGCAIQGVQQQENQFEVVSQDATYQATKLIVATGGLSFPKLGATGLAFDLARQFGLAIVPPAPALDGFVFAPAEMAAFEGLAGLSAAALVTCGGKQFAEPVLITHVGLSGPGALQASLYWRPGMQVGVQFNGPLPRRLAQRLDQQKILPEDWRFVPAGTVGYGKAEATRGGVDTAELSSKTMECRKVPGLYFIGEAVDVTGELGGFNFQWAWSSGVAAGEAV